MKASCNLSGQEVPNVVVASGFQKPVINKPEVKRKVMFTGCGRRESQACVVVINRDLLRLRLMNFAWYRNFHPQVVEVSCQVELLENSLSMATD